MGADAISAEPVYDSARMTRTLLIGLLAIVSSGCESSAPSRPSRAAAITVDTADGRACTPLTLSQGQSAAVLVFVLQDCPICNGYAPRIRRLVSQFSPHGARFYLVQVDPALTDAQALAHAKEYGYSIPVMVDRRHELVGRLRVVAVPTAVVLGADGTVQYTGRIDDRYFALGKPREAATTNDLSNALTAVVEHKPPAVARTKVIGCAVPDLVEVGNAR